MSVLCVIESESEYQRARREFIDRRLRWKREAREIDEWTLLRARADADNAFRDTILRTGAVRAALVARTAGPQFQIKLVQIVISQRYMVSHFDMVSARRTATIVLPRQIACWAAKYLTCRSLPEIGRQFGGRDHTTVLHAVTKIDRMRERDSVFRTTTDGDYAAVAHGLDKQKIEIAARMLASQTYEQSRIDAGR